MISAVRIGIDVGGTYTHAVAIDSTTLTIIGKAKVLTTHSAQEGVAKGIIDALTELLKKSNILPEAVNFIAHSTTQATNALLEGDVASVGILGMGKGAHSWLSWLGTRIKNIELAKGKFLTTRHVFINTAAGLTEPLIQTMLDLLINKGSQSFAVSEAFATDDTSREDLVLKVARRKQIPATSGSEVSKLYGLSVRTRTAIINAAMLPKMIETANMTEQSVRRAEIKAPIMIMRSDGGVMGIEAMREKPILTRLSGPAAGVAAAMMYLNISDGIFLEVGGTSTDISVIRNGKALIKETEIAGHRVYLRSLDVKTVGVAGGSMVRVSNNKIIDIGPRSAHIAGLGYVSFASQQLDYSKIRYVHPLPADPGEYVALAAGEDAPLLTLTPTCAANFLQLIPEGNCAKGKDELVAKAFTILAQETHQTPEDTAKQILKLASKKCLPLIKQFIADYKLEMRNLVLVGGGGGAAALVPFIASEIGVESVLAENADVISAIGVALALVRETIERNIIQPKEGDILRVREEAFDVVQKMGAHPSSIEVYMEIDTRKNIVRATACGAMGLTESAIKQGPIDDNGKIALVAASLNVDSGAVSLMAQTDYFQVFGAEVRAKSFLGLLGRRRLSLRTLDSKGVIRVKTDNGVVRIAEVSQVSSQILSLIEEHAIYSDAGKVIPNIMLLAGPRIIDLTGLFDSNSVIALARAELGQIAPDSKAIVIADLP